MLGDDLVKLIEEELETNIKKWEEQAKHGIGTTLGTKWRPDKKELEGLQRMIAVHQMIISLAAAKQTKSNLAIPKSSSR